MDLSSIITLIDNQTDFSFAKEAIKNITNSLKIFDSESTFVCFNGGKDAQVVLHLVRLALYKHCNSDMDTFKKEFKKIRVVYFRDKEPLEEVELFMAAHSNEHEFSLITLKENIKEETKTLVNEYGMKFIYLGTRRTDPYCNHQEYLCQSDVDKGWAPFLRINPIIDWSYEQVWIFLRSFKYDYCNLYDLGYTHIGNKDNSHKNPFLKVKDESKDDNIETYLPAYHANGKHENFSRSKFKLDQKYFQCESFILLYDKKPNEILSKIKDILALIGSEMQYLTILNLEELDSFLHINKLNPEKTLIAYSKPLEVQINESFKNLENFQTIKIN